VRTPTLRERYESWRKQVASEKIRLVEKVKEALREMLTPEEAQRVYIFGSCVWGTPHWRSDLDLAIDDEGLSTEAAWRLWNKVFSVAERFFGEERVDVCFMSELPENLKQKIQNKGERLYDEP